MNFKRINWLGLAGGLATLVLVILSVAYSSPWWQLTIGQELGQIDVSPLNFSLNVLGTPIVIPIIWFFNLACLLSFTACAIAMLIYSVIPQKGYSKNLLDFAYKKPLVVAVTFLVILLVVTYAVGALLQIGIPLSGSANAIREVEDMTVEISITAGFTWVFWLAIIATGLCIAAKFYHKKVTPPIVTT